MATYKYINFVGLFVVARHTRPWNDIAAPLVAAQGAPCKPIEWNNGLSVGVQKLDEQHKELIRIINALAQRDPADQREELTNPLDRMTRDAEHHFRTEEAFMLGHGFRDYTSHKREHTEFEARTAHFCLGAMANKAALPEELLLYLTDWLQNHILKSDMKYKNFLVRMGLAELPTKD